MTKNCSLLLHQVSISASFHQTSELRLEQTVPAETNESSAEKSVCVCSALHSGNMGVFWKLILITFCQDRHLKGFGGNQYFGFSMPR